MKSATVVAVCTIAAVLLYSGSTRPGYQNVCGAASAAESGLSGRKLQKDHMLDGDHQARLLHLTRSVNSIIDEYVDNRPVIMFAEEVRQSELGQRLLADMIHPRLLVSAGDLRPANGLLVYLKQRNGRSTDYETVLGRLPSSDHSRHMVLWGGVRDGRAGNDDHVDLHQVQVMFETFWQYQLIDVAVLVPTSTGSIRVYAFNPYTASRCNKAGPPIMINIWSGWINAFVKPDRVFGLDDKLKDLHR